MKQFLKGILFGATVGATSGLLFAPRSGKETQKMIESYIDDTTDATKDFNESLQNFQKAATATQQAIQETIPVVTTSINKSIQAFKFQAEPRLERINEQSDQLQEHLAQFPIVSDENLEE